MSELEYDEKKRIRTAAEAKQISLTDFTISLFEAESLHRHQNDLKKRVKAAQLPVCNDLGAYDHAVENGLSKNQFNKLRELT